MDREIQNLLDSYPDKIKVSLYRLRRLILEVAEEEGLTDIEECTKWGQISYVSRIGSTIRIDSHGVNREQFALYVHCQSRLIETYKELYNKDLTFDGKRAVVFVNSETIPVKVIKHCISLALRYHKVKHLPLLGA